MAKFKYFNPPAASSPTTLGDVGDAYARYTLKKPNGVTPDSWTGALPHAALMSGAGMLLGHYALPSVVKALMPGADGRKLKRMGGLAGALLGAGIAAPNLWSHYNGGGTKALFGNTAPLVMRKEAFWNNTVIDVNELQQAQLKAVYNGTADPTSALLSMQAAEAAQRNGAGFATPKSLATTVGRKLIQAGVALPIGYAIGKVTGALGGAFGLLGPAGKDRAAQTGAIVAPIMNMMFGASR